MWIELAVLHLYATVWSWFTWYVVHIGTPAYFSDIAATGTYAIKPCRYQCVHKVPLNGNGRLLHKALEDIVAYKLDL